MDILARCFMSVLLLSAVLSSGLAEEKFFGEGRTLELRPKFSGEINTVTWKLENDMVAEWLASINDLSYYSTFKGRTNLDKVTGILNITNMSPADSGVYSVEINNKVLPEKYTAKLIKEVPQPVVELKPLACAATSESCTLHCERKPDEAVALTEAEPVTYSWKMEGDWEDGEDSRTIVPKETKRIKTFSCRMKNPISDKQSDPKENIFYDKDAVDGEIASAGGLGAGAVFGIIVVVLVLVLVLPIVIIVVLVKLGKLKLEDIRRLLPCLPGGGVGNKDEEAERQPLAESKSNAAGTVNGSPNAETITETKAGADGERDAAADGERTAAADGERTAAADGERDAAVDGERDAAADGERTAAVDGERDAAADGERDAAVDGERTAAVDGERDAAVDGERDAAADGERDAAADGERDAAVDGERGAASDGERGAAADGERGAAADGERGAASDGERGAASDAASKADEQSSAESDAGTGREPDNTQL